MAFPHCDANIGGVPARRVAPQCLVLHFFSAIVRPVEGMHCTVLHSSRAAACSSLQQPDGVFRTVRVSSDEMTVVDVQVERLLRIIKCSAEQRRRPPTL